MLVYTCKIVLTLPLFGRQSSIDKHTQPDTGSGEWCLDSLMKDNYGTLTAPDIVRSIAALYQTGDAHVAVYDFNSASTLVSYGAYTYALHRIHGACALFHVTGCWLYNHLHSTASPSGFGKAPLTVTKAYDRPYTKFNMTALFEWQPVTTRLLL